MKIYRQKKEMDCGPACLYMIVRYYKINVHIDVLRKYCNMSSCGVTLQGIVNGAKAVCLQALAVKIDLQNLIVDIPFPCILHWQSNHFVVLHKFDGERFYILNPAFGPESFSKEEFKQRWMGVDVCQGIVVVILKY